MSSKVKEVTFFPRYGALGASSRVRLLQYIPFVEAAGYFVKTSTLISSDMLSHSYQSGGYRWVSLLLAYQRRLFVLLFRRPKLSFVEKEFFPYMPFVIERLFLPKNFILDIDDSIHVQYRVHKNPIVRFLLRNKIEQLMRRSACVVAGSDHLAEYARQAGAAYTLKIPSTVKSHRFRSPVKQPTDKITLVWIGSPSTLQYLEMLRPIFSSLEENSLCEFWIIGADARDFSPRLGGNVRFFDWSEEQQFKILSRADIGLMPLPDTEFERGKCAYKLIQYMSCGLALAASPVGENEIIVQDGVSGILFSSPAVLEDFIMSWLRNPQQVARMKIASYTKFQDGFSTEARAGEITSLFDDVFSKRAGF